VGWLLAKSWDAITLIRLAEQEQLEKRGHAKTPQSELDCAQERSEPAAAIPRTAWRVMGGIP